MICTYRSCLVIDVGWGHQLHITLVFQGKVHVGLSCKHFFKPQISNPRDNYAS